MMKSLNTRKLVLALTAALVLALLAPASVMAWQNEEDPAVAPYPQTSATADVTGVGGYTLAQNVIDENPNNALVQWLIAGNDQVNVFGSARTGNALRTAVAAGAAPVQPQPGLGEMTVDVNLDDSGAPLVVTLEGTIERDGVEDFSDYVINFAGAEGNANADGTFSIDGQHNTLGGFVGYDYEITAPDGTSIEGNTLD